MSARHEWLVREGFDDERIYRSPDLTYSTPIEITAYPLDRDGAAISLTIEGAPSCDLTAAEASEVMEWLGMALEVVGSAKEKK